MKESTSRDKRMSKSGVLWWLQGSVFCFFHLLAVPVSAACMKHSQLAGGWLLQLPVAVITL